MVDLEAIKATLANADPGPWAIGKKYAAVIVPSMEQDCECKTCPQGERCNDEYGGKLVGESIQRHNAEFIANAPSDIATLIEEVERLREHIKRWLEQANPDYEHIHGIASSDLSPSKWPDFCYTFDVERPCPEDLAKAWKDA